MNDKVIYKLYTHKLPVKVLEKYLKNVTKCLFSTLLLKSKEAKVSD